MTRFKEYKLGELCTITSSKRIFYNEYVSEGVPFFRSKEIIEKANGNAISTELFITKEKFKEIKDKFGVPLAGDILLTSVGTLGVSYQVQQSDYFYFKDGNLTWFKEFSDLISTKFLLYWLRSPFGKESFNNITIGSTQAALTIAGLKGIKLSLPDLPTQTAIAEILSSLDDKIELNNKINQELENLAQTLFKQWFVDFEFPDENGNPYKSSGGEMVDSELGEIPKGWEVGSITNLLDFNPNEKVGKGAEIPYLDMAALPTQGSYPFEPINRKVGSGMKFRNGDTLLARITPCLENGKTAYIQCLDDSQVGWGSTEFIVLRSINGWPCEISYLIARLQSFREYAIQSMVGTSGRQRVQTSHLKTFSICYPNETSIKLAFGNVLKPIFENIKSNCKENQSLITLRDTLLPKLISGELEVPEVLT